MVKEVSASHRSETTGTATIPSPESEFGFSPLLPKKSPSTNLDIAILGTLVGPPLSSGLKSIYGDSRVATEGVNYAAIPAPNFLPGGTDGPSIAAMSSVLLGAAMNCPASKVVVGGYSQGAAVAHRSIESLPPVAKSQIVGVLTVGDTQKMQDGSRIFNFPPDRVSFLCNPGDVICDGQLVVLAPHLDYTRRAGEGVGFLASKIGIL